MGHDILNVPASTPPEVVIKLLPLMVIKLKNRWSNMSKAYDWVWAPIARLVTAVNIPELKTHGGSEKLAMAERANPSKNNNIA